MQTITDSAKIPHDLMCGLIYPAVLGGVIFNAFFASPVSGELLWNNFPAYFLVIAIITHYAVDYIYTMYFESYSWDAFILDIAIVALLVLAINSVQPSTGKVDARSIQLFFSATYLIFFLIDIFTIWGRKRALFTLFIELLFAGLFAGMWFFELHNVMLLSMAIFGAAGTLYLLSPKPLNYG